MQRTLFLFSIFLFFNGCAMLSQFAILDKPSVSDYDISFKSLSLSAITLDVTLDVFNPNPVELDLNKFDYQLNIDDKPLLSGDQSSGLKVNAKGTTPVIIPIALKYDDILSIGSDLLKQDSIDYQFQSNFSFDIPGYGEVTIPFSFESSLPVLKKPSFNFKGVSLDKISFTGAELTLKIEVSNPNSFAFDVAGLTYDFVVNNKKWISSQLSDVLSIGAGSSKYVEIPISLNISEMGSSLYSMLTSGNIKFDYDLIGKAKFNSGLDLISDFELPFNLNGVFSIIK